MKTTLHFVIIIVLATAGFTTHAQTMLIPNGDLESWTAGSPDLWLLPYPTQATITEVTGNGGGSAARCEVIAATEEDACYFVNYGADFDDGFAVDQNYSYLVFDYKFHYDTSGQLHIIAVFRDDTYEQIAYTTTPIPSADTWTQASVPITYWGTAAAGMVEFFFTGGGGLTDPPEIGSYLELDNVYLSNTVGISESEPTEPCATLFPNPAANTTQLSITLLQSSTAEIFIADYCGKEVQRISAGVLSAGENRIGIDVSGMASGVYMVGVKCGGKTISNQLLAIAPSR